MHWTAEHGLDAIVKIIHHYTTDEQSINDCDHAGYSPLHYAATNNRLSTVEYLISAGARVNHTCAYGGEMVGPSALHLAAARGHLEVVQYLVSVGANIDCSHSDHRTLFGDTPLAWAVVNKHLPVVLCLIDAGCDLDKADNDYNTPLHKAGYLGLLSIVELLVRRGANVRINNHRQENVIEISRRGGSQEVMGYLAG